MCVFFLPVDKVQQSEEEVVQMEPFSDDNKIHGREDAQDNDEYDESDKLIMCRICYDGIYAHINIILYILILSTE